MPFSISRSSAGACTTSPAQTWQAYLGRRVTITLNCAGITSSRSAPVPSSRRRTAWSIGRQARQRRTKPLVDDLRLWLEAQLAAVSGKSTIAGAIRYALSRWEGLTRFLDDGRIEIDSNVVERSIRPIALGRKNHLFAGSDGGGEQWAVIASLVETCKMNAVDPQAYLHDVLSKIVARHP